MICDVPDKARLLLDCVSGKGKTVKRIVLVEAFDADLVTRGRECGVEILSLKDFEVRIRVSFSPCARCSKHSPQPQPSDISRLLLSDLPPVRALTALLLTYLAKSGLQALQRDYCQYFLQTHHSSLCTLYFFFSRT